MSIYTVEKNLVSNHVFADYKLTVDRIRSKVHSKGLLGDIFNTFGTTRFPFLQRVSLAVYTALRSVNC